MQPYLSFCYGRATRPILNPIEHIQELMKQQIYKNNRIYTSLNALEHVWSSTWDDLTLEDINECILGLSGRIP